MTDREQIIIDDVDVSGCINHTSYGNCITYGNTPCGCFPDCDFKQLARKTKECNRYRKALKTIEEICLNDVHTFADGTQLRYNSLDDILDVIKRLKEAL